MIFAQSEAGRPGQENPERTNRQTQVMGTHKPDSATSRHAFEPSTPAVTSAMQFPPCGGVRGWLGWGLGKGGDRDGTRRLASGSSLWLST